MFISTLHCRLLGILQDIVRVEVVGVASAAEDVEDPTMEVAMVTTTGAGVMVTHIALLREGL